MFPGLTSSTAYISSTTPYEHLTTTLPTDAAKNTDLPACCTVSAGQTGIYAEDPEIVVECIPGTEGLVANSPTHVTDSRLCLREEPMKAVKTKATIGLLTTLISYVTLNSIYRSTHPEAFIWQDEDREEAQWLRSSKSWIDRKACRWLSVCGGSHVHLVGKKFGTRPRGGSHHRTADNDSDWNWQDWWTEGKNKPEDWTKDERVIREIPDYVTEYAPLVHLSSKEQFWPCDIAEHLHHITPSLNYTPLQSENKHPTLRNLNKLNNWDRGRWVFLTSNDNVEERPEWLEGQKNIPVSPSDPNDTFQDNDGWIHHPGRTLLEGVKEAFSDLRDWFAPGLQMFERHDDFRESLSGMFRVQKEADSFRRPYHDELKRRTSVPGDEKLIRGGRSDAPAVLIIVNKGHGVVDAFWFFFYSFNLGNVVFSVRFGNHVGDWEHTAIRFHNGKPKAVFFSEHNFGSAYSYEAVEKIGKRPVIYSAVGTHAMYATSGLHPYILPWGILRDETDRGPLWDPALNSHAYTYDLANGTLRSSNLTPNAPTGWFHFAGHWGDKFYPLNDKRQYRIFGQYHYVNGPLGPKFKHLARKKICQGPDTEPCIIKHWLGGENKNGILRAIKENPEDGLEYIGDDTLHL